MNENDKKIFLDLISMLRKEVEDLHSHLSIQDAKLNHIVRLLEDVNGSSRDL